MRQRGFTLLELILTIVILTIFTAVTIPIAKNTYKRQQEIELRRALRELRTSIDQYRQVADSGLIKSTEITPTEQCMGGQLNTGCYPPNLEILVKGVPLSRGVNKKIKLLRQIPIDPMTGKAEWGMKSFKQDSDSRSWDSQNVFDVYSQSDGTALDGSKYRDW